MIAPMNFNYKSGVISEKFTYTKGTGTFNDAMRFGLPTIVPYEYQVAKEFEPCFLKYTNSNHLGNLIIELVQDQQKLFRLKMKTELMKNYSLNKCQEIFKTFFRSLISKNKSFYKSLLFFSSSKSLHKRFNSLTKPTVQKDEYKIFIQIE